MNKSAIMRQIGIDAKLLNCKFYKLPRHGLCTYLFIALDEAYKRREQTRTKLLGLITNTRVRDEIKNIDVRKMDPWVAYQKDFIATKGMYHPNRVGVGLD